MLTPVARAELEQLKASLAESLSGRSSAVIVEGPVGSGKSELLESLVTHAAAEGALVLRAAALRSESGLPLGVMRQLVESPALPAAAARDLQELLDAYGTAADSRENGRRASVRTAEMQRLSAVLQEAMDGRLTLLAVDDLQHVDADSLEYLLHLAGRWRSMPLMLVFTEVLDYRRWAPAHRTAFVRLPNFRRLRLECFGRDEVRALIAGCTGSVPEEAALDYAYGLTGGNPLLLRALGEDRQPCNDPPDPRDPDDPAAPMVGDVFAHAVLTCLDRCGPMAAQVAHALAVFGDTGTPDRLVRLTGLSQESVAQGLRALGAAGLADGVRFRHRAVRDITQDSMDPGLRKRLHQRAAGLLYADGAPASAVGRHLRALDDVDEPWGVAVLREAAEEALAEYEDPVAVDCLELAHRYCTDREQRIDIRLRLGIVQQRWDLAASERIGVELLGPLRAEELTAQQCMTLADLLLRHRHIDAATEALARVREAGTGVAEGAGAHLMGSPQAAVVDIYHSWGDTDTRDPDPARERHYVLPWIAPVQATHDDVVGSAEKLLQRTVLTDSSNNAVNSAVKTLIYAGAAERARHWADVLLAEATRRRLPGWTAMFAGLRASVALYLGALGDAERFSVLGLSQIRDRKDSTGASGLIALQVLAQTAMGNYEGSARNLNHPTPGYLFNNSHGLLYLQARGRYYLATNRLRAALEDFLAQGRIARNWRVDQPIWVPWRTDAAEALLALGQPAEARRLITEQLAMVRSSHTRVRGISTRFLAATETDQDKRLDLLNQAIALVQAAGDRLELAIALYELGETHRARGESAQAAAAWRRSWHLARECGAEPLCARLRIENKVPQEDEATTGPRAGTPAVDIEKAQLSASERRVAVLAACGYSNRDISSRLYISVSTVEQHLTRVYRKLQIGGREQLPIDLQFQVGHLA